MHHEEREGEKSEKEKNAYAESSDFTPLSKMPVCSEETNTSGPEQQKEILYRQRAMASSQEGSGGRRRHVEKMQAYIGRNRGN